jgi:hypothetical protein
VSDETRLEAAVSAPRPKKIAIIGLAYPFRGGISHYSTLLVRELRSKYAVLFLTLKRQYPAWFFPGKTQYDISTAKLVEENHAIIDSVNPLTWIKTLFFLKKEKIDLLVVQWWNPFFFSRLRHYRQFTSLRFKDPSLLPLSQCTSARKFHL